jgi:hypothetical protein
MRPLNMLLKQFQLTPLKNPALLSSRRSLTHCGDVPVAAAGLTGNKG